MPCYLLLLVIGFMQDFKANLWIVKAHPKLRDPIVRTSSDVDHEEQMLYNHDLLFRQAGRRCGTDESCFKLYLLYLSPLI